MSQTDIDRIIVERRTIHSFSTETFPEEILLDAIKVALYAPNHRLTQPIRVNMLENKESREILHNIYLKMDQEKNRILDQSKLQKRRNMVMNPPYLLVVSRVINPHPVVAREDFATIACFIHNLSLSLWAHGIGLKWSTGDLMARPELYQLLAISPNDETIEALVPVGMPQEIKEAAKRIPLEQVIRRI